MAIEHAAVQVVRKPWGVADLKPWSGIDGSGDAVGELWFQRVVNYGTYDEAVFAEVNVTAPSHPDHAELLDILRHPVLRRSSINIGDCFFSFFISFSSMRTQSSGGR